MTDPLSVAGSVVGVISLGIQVTTSLVNFYKSYKGQESDIIHITEKLDGLVVILQGVETTLSGRKFHVDERSLVQSIETSIKDCDEMIQELRHECQKISKPSSDGTRAAIKLAGRRVTYPFRQSTLQKLDEDIDELRANLSTALDVLQLKDNQRMQDEITEINWLLDLVRASQVSSDLRNWLKAPDAFHDHNVAVAKKHPGTGVWLIKSDNFSKWMAEGNSMMWLNGFAGSGKSVLCSTVIQFVSRHGMSDKNVGVAFFYFTFNDQSKQDESSMLRALLLQLSHQLRNGSGDLAQLHDRYTTGIPPSSALLDYLRRIVESFSNVYIMLDALDESPLNGRRKYVLDALEAMRDWGVQSLHLFVTSRDESDIRESLDLSSVQEVNVHNGGMDRDINDFVSSRLNKDRRLLKLKPYRQKIQESLASRAKGMFRWVECQLEALRLCPSSEYHIDHMLNSLPESLDETYERMLCNINYHLAEDARRILTLLCFTRTPLTVPELIDGVAVEINGDSLGLNHKRRLQDSNGIRDICGGFIEIYVAVKAEGSEDGYGWTGEEGGEEEKGEEGEEGEEVVTEIVRIAHFSVQEYLESDRIRRQKAAKFSLTSNMAHAEIAQICLTYLCERGLSQLELNLSIVKDHPLASYAAESWYYHHENATSLASSLHDFILKLFRCRDSFVTWVRLYDPDNWSNDQHRYALKERITRLPNSIPNPIYYASLLGLDQILRALISTSQDGSEVSRQITAKGGTLGQALEAASYRGHDNVVQILLDRGADINASGGYYDNALQAASRAGHGHVIQILLDKGADINAQGGRYDTALQSASRAGYIQIVQLLLEKGANINAQGGPYGNVLQLASVGGHVQTVQLLLEKGANVNAQGGFYGDALQAASYRGHAQIVQLLLEKGANINAEGGEYSNALQAATFGGHVQVVELLLEKGANVNAEGGTYGNALQAASYKGYIQIVQLLLEKGANINAEGGEYSNALQAVSVGGHIPIVQLLLDKGADVNAEGEEYSNALQAASVWGHAQIVQLLLDKGAHVNAHGGLYENALEAASCNGRDKVVQLLLDRGAVLDAKSLEKSLREAKAEKYDRVVQLLQDHAAASRRKLPVSEGT